jgi:hypothetical protein
MAQRASHMDVTSKFDPIEFSPLRFIQATAATQSNEVQVARENLDPLVGCNTLCYCTSSNLIMVDYG